MPQKQDFPFACIVLVDLRSLQWMQRSVNRCGRS